MSARRDTASTEGCLGTLVLFLVVCFLCGLYQYFFPPPPCNKSFTERQNVLHGVKSLVEKRFETIEISGKIDKGKPTSSWGAKFNEVGDLVDIESSKESKGDLCARYYYEIDSLNSNGIDLIPQSAWSVSNLDYNNTLEETKYYFKDGQIIDYQTIDILSLYFCEDNSEKPLIKEEIIKRTDSILIYKNIEEYKYVEDFYHKKWKHENIIGLDSLDILIKKQDIIRYDTDGNIDCKYTYIYEYDSIRNDCISTTIYKNEEAIIIINREYEYYD